MSNPARRKGNDFAEKFVRWLQDNGYPKAERRVQHGAFDRGDVINGPDEWTIELKNVQALSPGFVDEAAREAVNAETPLFAAVMKRRGKSDPGEALVVMPARIWLEWLQSAADRAA